MNEKGFANIILVIAVLIIIGGGAGYLIFNKSASVSEPNSPTPISPTSQQNPVTPDSDSNTIKRSDWGISFAKISNWAITGNTNQQIDLEQISGEWEGDKITVLFISGEKITTTDSKFGDTTIWFDQGTNKWMAARQSERDGTQITTEAIPSFYAGGDLPVFGATGRWLTYVMPLSHTTFLKFNITGSGYTQPLMDLVKTIIKL